MAVNAARNCDVTLPPPLCRRKTRVKKSIAISVEEKTNGHLSTVDKREIYCLERKPFLKNSTLGSFVMNVAVMNVAGE